ncbi:MAG: RNA methyltransferase [Desulfobacterota bacterium]|nr:RNA methyltransferase [Thermodesulfobacteriota bacterium]
MGQRIVLDQITLVLVRPRFPENIGSVARAMKNMGLSRLAIVNGASPLHRNAFKLASGAEEILERAEEFPDLGEAISGMACVVGTTCREGKERTPLLSPGQLAKRLAPLSQRNLIGIVFGSEREGLTNEELSLCHLFARIPSSESFPSLNLSHAVAIFCYELFQWSGTFRRPPPSLATSEQLERLFSHMEHTLIRIGFLDPKHPKRMMRTLRRLFGRSKLDEREVRILHGIWSKVDWALENRRGGGDP